MVLSPETTRPVCDVHHGVDDRVFHRHRGVIASILGPGLRKIALDEFCVGNLVVDALAFVLGQVAAEIRKHLRGREGPKRIDILAAISSLDGGQKLLEGLIVLLLDLNRA